MAENPASLRRDLRPIYHSWRIGARYTTDDVIGLVARARLGMTRNQIREFGRDSDRSTGITVEQLAALMGAWAEEQAAARAAARKAPSAPDSDSDSDPRRARLLGEIAALRREPDASGRLLDVIEDLVRNSC